MRVPLDRARPGMVLSAPLADPRGRFLLRKGETLSERFLAKLASLGVAAVDVEDAPAPAAAPVQADAEAMARIDEALERRFALFPPGPWREELFDAARRTRVDRFADLRDFVSDEAADG